MKNLENFGVKELSLEESMEVNGGIAGTTIFIAGVIVGYWLASR